MTELKDEDFIQHDINLYLLDVTGEEKQQILQAVNEYPKLKKHYHDLAENFKITNEDKKKILTENQKLKEIVDRLRKQKKLFDDGFSTFEGYIEYNSSLRDVIKEFFQEILGSKLTSAQSSDKSVRM